MRLILCGVQSPVNIGMILRSSEIYRVHVCIWDIHGVMTNADKVTTVSDFACGALQRSPPEITKDWKRAVLLEDRCIATDIDPNCPHHTAFQWLETDQILIGNEYDGVPEELLAKATHKVTIPMPQGYFPKPASHSPIDPSRKLPPASSGQPSLNAAVAASILLSTAYALRRY